MYVLLTFNDVHISIVIVGGIVDLISTMTYALVLK